MCYLIIINFNTFNLSSCWNSTKINAMIQWDYFSSWQRELFVINERNLNGFDPHFQLFNRNSCTLVITRGQRNREQIFSSANEIANNPSGSERVQRGGIMCVRVRNHDLSLFDLVPNPIDSPIIRYPCSTILSMIVKDPLNGIYENKLQT